VPNLALNDLVPALKHEGLYSLLIRLLVATEDPAQILPPFLPGGILLDLELPDELNTESPKGG
jgi:hypothetical protein